MNLHDPHVGLQSVYPLTILGDALIKGAVLLGIAGVATLAMRRAAASTRYLVWTIALGGVLVLPVLSAVAPGWRLRILPVPGATVAKVTRAKSPARRARVASAAAQVRRRPALPSASLTVPVSYPSAAGAGHLISVPAGMTKSPAIATKSPPAPAAIWREATAHWPFLLLLVWGAGVATIGVPGVIGYIRIRRRLARGGVLAAGRIARAAAGACKELKLRRPVRIMAHAGVGIPLTHGVFKPRVLLPEAAESWPEDRLQSVLLHELAHVARWDCATLLIGQIVCALHWLDPLVWVARRRLCGEGERACDDAVIRCGIVPVSYAENLLTLARDLRRSHPFQPATLAIARRSGLKGRIAAILDDYKNRKPISVGRAAGMLILGAAVVAAFAAIRLQAQAQPTTNVSGVISAPPAAKPAFAKTMTTLALPRGTVISGRVVDDHGEPIVGAHVLFWVTMKQDNSPVRVDGRPRVVLTGRNGVWRYSGIPAHGVSELTIGAWDYRYVWYRWSSGIHIPMRSFTDLTKFRNGQAVLILPRGIMVHGVVLGPDGKPVAGAQIAVGSDQNASNMPSPMKADAAGQFSFAAKPGHGVVITARAKGYGPALGLFHIRANSPSIFLRLTAPHTLTGRVVGPAGRPLADAYVSTDSWRGYRTLIHHMRTNSRGWFIWRDAPAGEVLVDAEAPGYAYAMDISVRAGKDNRIILLPRVTVHGTVVDAGTDQPIDKFRVITGSVWGPTASPADASWNSMTSREVTGDGRFVRTFRFQYGAYAIQIKAKGYRPAAKVFSNNARNIILHFRLVRAGKITVRVLNPDGTPAVGAKALLVSVGREGIIYTGGHFTGRLANRFHITDARGTLTFAPQADGYEIAVHSNAGYAAWSSGHPPKNGLVTLRRWGSIHGRVMLGTRPVAGRIVEADVSSPPGPPGEPALVQWQGEVRTGSKGEFSIPRLPAGEALVVLLSRHKQTYPLDGAEEVTWVRELPQTVTVESGKTVHVTLGSVGCPVEGTIEVPSALANRHDWHFDLGIASPAFPTALYWPIPESVRREPFVKRAKWIRKFAATTAGKALWEKRKRWWSMVGLESKASPAGKALWAKRNRWWASRMYTFLVKSRRTFTIPGVVPGTYRVEIMALRVGHRGVNPNSIVGTVNGKFTVPPIPGGVSDVPLKLPPLKLAPIKPANAQGAPAQSIPAGSPARR